MDDRRDDAYRTAPGDQFDEECRRIDASSQGAMTTPTWSVYDGRPEPVSDGDPPIATPPRRRRAWPWLLAGIAATAAIIAGATVGVTPKGPGSESRQPAVVAPARWGRVDASLTAGLVIVHGGAEADGIVMTPTGLVATSYTRIKGDVRPPADGFELRIAADRQDAVPATIVGADITADIALVRAPGFVPRSVATPGTTPARVGERLTLLDDQGGKQPVVGVGVTVTATNHTCSRAGSRARPKGFQFSLDVASAEPGAALVRADGTVVGMYYGGDDAAHHCAIPIADVVEVVRTSNR